MEDKLIIRQLSSMERVFPRRELKGKEWNSASVLKKERLHYQAAFFWNGYPEWASVSVKTQLKQVSIRSVELVPGEYVYQKGQDENFLTTEPGLFPDILQPLETDREVLKLLPEAWNSLWITAETKEEAAGTYPITIQILIKGEIKAEATFCLTILPAELPEQKLLYTQWFHTDCIAHWYQLPVFSEDWWSMVEKYAAYAASRGQNMLLTPLFTPPLDTQPGTERPTVQLVDVYAESRGEGKTDKGAYYEPDTDMIYRFGFSKLIRWTEMCRRCGIRFLEGSHLFTQWGAEHAPKILASVNGSEPVRIFGWETEALGEAYQNFLRQLLPALNECLRGHGLSKAFAYHISDEPNEKHLEHYGRISAFLRQYTEEFPIMDALSEYSFYEKGYVSMPVCATEHIAPYLEHQVDPLFGYYCGCHVHGVSNRLLAMPGARNRCIGLQLYDSKVNGFLQWGYNFWMTQNARAWIDPYKVSDAGRAFGSGDSFSVYPGTDGAIAAVGLELFSEGLQDLRALELAEHLCGREAVEKLYQELDWKAFSSCPSEAREVLSLREAVNELIASALTENL